METKVTIGLFRKGDESASILRAWWRGLEHFSGERAFLRRAPTPSEVVFSPAYHLLLNDLKKRGYVPSRMALACVAGLSGHVAEDTGPAMSFAQQMASSVSGGGGARVSGLRFRRLLAVKDRAELYPILIRIIRLLGRRVNLVSLAEAVYWWSESTRMQLAYDYYSIASKEK